MAGNEPVLGQYGRWIKATATDFAEKTEIYKALSQLFAKISHTHTIANITNLQTTLNGKANSSHTHTTSQITDIAKSSYTLTNWETTNFSTCDVTFHKQLNMVTCIYHINTVTFANKNDHTVTASEIPSAYRPSSIFYQDICTYGGQKLDGLLTVGTDGSMKIRMGTANTSMNVYGSFTYIV